VTREKSGLSGEHSRLDRRPPGPSEKVLFILEQVRSLEQSRDLCKVSRSRSRERFRFRWECGKASRDSSLRLNPPLDLDVRTEAEALADLRFAPRPTRRTPHPDFGRQKTLMKLPNQHAATFGNDQTAKDDHHADYGRHDANGIIFGVGKKFRIRVDGARRAARRRFLNEDGVEMQVVVVGAVDDDLDDLRRV